MASYVLSAVIVGYDVAIGYKAMNHRREKS
jgi:hypothetical protein